MLDEVRRLPQADLLVQEFIEDISAWRTAIQAIFKHWRRGEAAGIDAADLQTRLDDMLKNLEIRIDAVLRQKAGSALSDNDNENFYRLLGGYRSLSEAVVEHARLVVGLNWEQWQEGRF